MCVDTYLYIPTARVFFGGFAHGLPGVGGGGWYGVGDCTMDPGLGQNVSRPSKTQLIFWCIPNKGKGERLLGEG